MPKYIPANGGITPQQTETLAEDITEKTTEKLDDLKNYFQEIDTNEYSSETLGTLNSFTFNNTIKIEDYYFTVSKMNYLYLLRTKDFQTFEQFQIDTIYTMTAYKHFYYNNKLYIFLRNYKTSSDPWNPISRCYICSNYLAETPTFTRQTFSGINHPYFKDVSFNSNGTFVAFGYQMYYSTNGYTWTWEGNYNAFDSNYYPAGVEYINNKFVIYPQRVGGVSKCYISDDGKNWSDYSTPSFVDEEAYNYEYIKEAWGANNNYYFQCGDVSETDSTYRDNNICYFTSNFTKWQRIQIHNYENQKLIMKTLIHDNNIIGYPNNPSYCENIWHYFDEKEKVFKPFNDKNEFKSNVALSSLPYDSENDNYRIITKDTSNNIRIFKYKPGEIVSLVNLIKEIYEMVKNINEKIN